jgi:type II secretory pathway pseudopilin PulG
MRTIATNHKVTRVPDDAVAYLALCLRARLQDLITAMIKAAKYRTDEGFDRPAGFYDAVDGGEPTPKWSIVVRNDVAKQLIALEKVEREEELRIRKERRERAEMQAAHAAALAAQAAGGASNIGGAGESGEDADSSMGGFGAPKKKRKKEGPGVTARNMSEDVRKKMSNAVATQAAGLGGRYAWMTSANATGAAAAAKPKPGTSATTSTTATSAAGSSWARPYIPSTKNLGALGAATAAFASGTGASSGTTASGQAESEEAAMTLTRISMRDAIFVINRERGHGGGRGSARGWS